MQLSRALRLVQPPPSLRDTSPKFREFGGGWEGVAFVGAGGKTTAMFQLARELRGRVVVTATSHLGAWQIPLADRHIEAKSPQEIGEPGDGVTLVTGMLDGDRTRPLEISILSWLYEATKRKHIPLLIEADGSHGRPLKAPAAHEPPIPDFVKTVIVVAGLSGLAKSLNTETVHRPELFARLSGLRLDNPVTPEAVCRVLVHPEGGLKNIPPAARKIALLNQADTPELQAIGGKMARELLNQFDAVIAGSLQQNNFNIFERLAGIVLAAGKSTRIGTPKQLLDWKGKPFVRQVAETALRAGLWPVIVVTGAEAEAVEKAVNDLDVKIVRNENWQSGQASSIVAGIQAIAPSALSGTFPKSKGFGEGREGVGGCFFLLADQPQIGIDVIQALKEAHAQRLPSILAPLVLEERRANPVLFDRVTFPDLLALTGDVGGRAIFGKHKVEYLPWHDETLLFDVDTPEDYERLKNL